MRLSTIFCAAAMAVGVVRANTFPFEFKFAHDPRNFDEHLLTQEELEAVFDLDKEELRMNVFDPKIDDAHIFKLKNKKLLLNNIDVNMTYMGQISWPGNAPIDITNVKMTSYVDSQNNDENLMVLSFDVVSDTLYPEKKLKKPINVKIHLDKSYYGVADDVWKIAGATIVVGGLISWAAMRYIDNLA